MSGLILLFFIAILIAFFWTRLRKRTGLKVSSKTWMGAIIVVALVAGLMYASSHSH